MRLVRLILIIILFVDVNLFAFGKINSERFLNGAIVTAIKGENNYIWISTYGSGIFRYSKRDGSWFNFSTKKGNSENDYFYSLAVSNRYLWAGTVDGLYTYDFRTKHWTIRKFALGGMMGNWIRTLLYDPSQNVLWIGRFENLTKLDVKKRKYTDHVLTRNMDTKTNDIKTIALDGDSLIWFGTEGGVFKFNKKFSINNNKAWGFISNHNGGFLDEGKDVSVTGILFDRKYIWFGTDEFITQQDPTFNVGGLYKFNRRHTWIRFSKKNGLPANGIYCMARTGNQIWVSTYSFDSKNKQQYGKGIVLINRLNGNIRRIDLDQINIKSSNITAMYFDGENMWLGTDDGLTKIVLENPLAVWGGKK